MLLWSAMQFQNEISWLSQKVYFWYRFVYDSYFMAHIGGPTFECTISLLVDTYKSDPLYIQNQTIREGHYFIRKKPAKEGKSRASTCFFYSDLRKINFRGIFPIMSHDSCAKLLFIRISYEKFSLFYPFSVMASKSSISNQNPDKKRIWHVGRKSNLRHSG